MKFIKYFLLFIFVADFCFINTAEGLSVFQPVNGSPFSTGDSPTCVAFSPEISGNLFAAVSNQGQSTVSVYKLNKNTGTFTPLTNVFGTGNAPASIAFSPVVLGNLFAAVANNIDNTLSVYQVSPSTGVFTQLSTVAAGNAPSSIAFSPIVSGTGKLFAAVTNISGNSVFVYDVNPNSGAFTQVASINTGNGSAPVSIAFSPEVSGNLFAAIANSGTNTVAVYQVNPSTGALTIAQGSPIRSKYVPQSVAFSSELLGDLFFAVANDPTASEIFKKNGKVSVYQVNTTTGALEKVSGSPFATGKFSASVAFSPEISGQVFAAVANELDNNASVYDVNFQGCVKPSIDFFTPATGSPIPTGRAPNTVAFSPEVSGNVFAAVVNGEDNTVSIFKVAPVNQSP